MLAFFPIPSPHAHAVTFRSLKDSGQVLASSYARVILQAYCEVNSSLLLETLNWELAIFKNKKAKSYDDL